jgi:hypothetical protein
MAAPQVKERLNANVQKVEERYPTYRDALTKALLDIVSIEKQKAPDHINRVEQRVIQLGDLISTREIAGQ